MLGSINRHIMKSVVVNEPFEQRWSRLSKWSVSNIHDSDPDSYSPHSFSTFSHPGQWFWSFESNLKPTEIQFKATQWLTAEPTERFEKVSGLTNRHELHQQTLIVWGEEGKSSSVEGCGGLMTWRSPTGCPGADAIPTYTVLHSQGSVKLQWLKCTCGNAQCSIVYCFILRSVPTPFCSSRSWASSSQETRGPMGDTGVPQLDHHSWINSHHNDVPCSGKMCPNNPGKET